MKPVTYGIIGFGGIAENRIVKEGFGLDKARFSPAEDCLLKGVTDADPSRHPAAAGYGLAWYADADELLSDPDIEAVYIAAPNSLHAELATRALSAGKHVLLEKPMTTSLEDALKLQATARRMKRSLSVNLMMMKNQLNRTARTMVRTGEIGTVNDIVTHMEFLYGSTPEEAAAWRCSQPNELGGPIGDVASHCMYMAEFLLDDTITEIRCRFTPETLPIAVENGAFISFVTAGGISGSVRAAFNQPRGGLVGTIENLGYELYGDRATLRGIGTLFQLSGHPDEPAAIRLEYIRNGKSSFTHPEDPENIYHAQLREHAASIRSGKLMDGSDGLHNLALVAAAYESARNHGEPVRPAAAGEGA